jgi:hypothetical protein
LPQHLQVVVELAEPESRKLGSDFRDAPRPLAAIEAPEHLTPNRMVESVLKLRLKRRRQMRRQPTVLRFDRIRLPHLPLLLQ